MFSKKESSVNAQLLQRAVSKAIEGFKLVGLAGVQSFDTLPAHIATISPVEPDGDRWRGTVQFSTIIFIRP
jgi:hypothetical protein